MLFNQKQKEAIMFMAVIIVLLTSCLATQPSFTAGTIPQDAVMFYSVNADSEGGMYFARAEDGSVNSLIANPSSSINIDCLSTSPDGSEIAFFDLKSLSIFIMNSDGSNIRQVTDSKIGGCPIWASDGKWLGFHDQIHNDNGEIIDTINALNISTKEVTTLPEKANNWFSSFTWVPHTHTIIYTIGEQVSYGGLYEYDLEKNQGGTILDNPNVVEAVPSISPDGTKIIYQEVTFFGNPYQNIFIADLTKDGILRPKSIVQTISNASGNTFVTACCISWSPSSEYFSINLSTMNNSEIFIYDKDGQLKKQLTNTSEWIEGASTWTGNSKYIVFTRNPTDMTHALNQLIVIDLDGNSEKILVSEPGMRFSFASP